MRANADTAVGTSLYPTESHLYSLFWANHGLGVGDEFEFAEGKFAILDDDGRYWTNVEMGPVLQSWEEHFEYEVEDLCETLLELESIHLETDPHDVVFPCRAIGDWMAFTKREIKRALGIEEKVYFGYSAQYLNDVMYPLLMIRANPHITSRKIFEYRSIFPATEAYQHRFYHDTGYYVARNKAVRDGSFRKHVAE